MSAMTDMLAHSPPDGEGEHTDEADPQKLAEASIKAFFEAGKKGDYSTAAAHFSAAMEHCEELEDPEGEAKDGPSGHSALLLVPHKG